MKDIKELEILVLAEKRNKGVLARGTIARQGSVSSWRRTKGNYANGVRNLLEYH